MKRNIHITHLGVILLTIGMMMLTALNTEAQVHTSRYYVQRAESYVQSNAWSEAKREIDAGLKIYPDDPDLRYLNGRFYYESKDLQNARYNLVRAIQRNDQHYHSKRVLVDVEDELGHYSSAICYINELLEFQPYDRDLWRRKISLYRKLGNHTEADIALERLSHIYPNDTLVRHDLRNRTRENWNAMLQKSNLHETADNLEQWLDIDPDTLSYYLELMSVYQRLGENERAIGVANRGLVRFPRNSELVRKTVGIMTDMGLYNQALSFAKQHGGTTTLYNGLLQEVANDARLKDPYEVNGKLYFNTHDREALKYLLNTSLTRGYYDDARLYLNESYKIYGRKPELLMKQYSLEKRVGNNSAMYRLLEELYAANPNDLDIIAEYNDRMLELANIDISQEQWKDACLHLQRALDNLNPTDEQWPAAVSRQIMILGKLRRFADARQQYREAVKLSPENGLRFASAYEDIVANRLRQLIDDEKYEQALNEADSLLDIIPNSEVALRCCINMSQTLNRPELFLDYARNGYIQYPDLPYFVVKYAIALHQHHRTSEALNILRPRNDADEYLNPQLVAAYSGMSQEWSVELMKAHNDDVALQVIDSALVYDASNKELLYTKGLLYEKKKQYDQAYNYQHKYYNPSNAEQDEWYQHMRYLHFRSLHNRIDASYTHASYDTRDGVLASTAHLYSTATVAYSRLADRNTYTGQLSYKGIDGFHVDNENESGGVGLEFMGQLEHVFNQRWSGMSSISYSTRYFNKWGLNASVSYYAEHGWTTTLKLGYRRTPRTYLFIVNDTTQNFTQGKYNLFILSPSIQKSWERINAGVNLDITSMNSDVYYNIGLKGKLFINNDNISSVSLLAGFGSFPELSFFEQTALKNLSHTNTMVGFDAQYLLTDYLYLGLSGSWNTCYDPHKLSDGSLTDSYRNIYTLTLQMHVAF